MQDPRVRATINFQDHWGDTALHLTHKYNGEVPKTSIFRILLQAGANPAVTNRLGETAVDRLRKKTPHHDAIALLEQGKKRGREGGKERVWVMAVCGCGVCIPFSPKRRAGGRVSVSSKRREGG